MLEEEQEAVLRNPFPSPPSHYQKYTSSNLCLLALLKERLSAGNSQPGDETSGDAVGKRDGEDVDVKTNEPLVSVSLGQQHDILKDKTDVPDWPLSQLEKPRVDWMLEDGYYNVYGDTWFVSEKIPSLGELGGHQLYPNDPTIDRRPALLSTLRSTLVSYSHLCKSLLLPPPSISASESAEDQRPEWSRHVEWLTVLAQNIMSAANDLRPVQARYNLENMMRRQVELRKEETSDLHRKCDELEEKLQQLKKMRASNEHNHSGNAAELSNTLHTTPLVIKGKQLNEAQGSGLKPTLEDVLRLAEGWHSDS